MRVSREQMAENRKTILREAGRLFRSRGFDAVTVAEVMQAAGLTHGAFYGHFKSKDDLIAHALAAALEESAAGEIETLAAYAASYLTPRHCRDLATGCATAGLGGETIRQGPAARAAMTLGLARQIDRLAVAAPGRDTAERRRAAMSGWAAMVGAMLLARLSTDKALSAEILEATRAALASAGPAFPGAQRSEDGAGPAEAGGAALPRPPRRAANSARPPNKA
jgi:TetR/AcrR family transcriptional regulator, transcriptional repressor for nem operon